MIYKVLLKKITNLTVPKVISKVAFALQSFDRPKRLGLWLFLGTFFALVGPTVINYSRYTLSWDESYYLGRIVCTNRAVYNLSLSALSSCLATTHKGPIMGLINLPWGPIGGTERGIGLAFVGLSAFVWALVLLTSYVCLRSGIQRGPLLLSGFTIFLTPFLRTTAGAMMTDTLLGWCVALALMLVPLEYASPSTGFLPSVWRGLLWSLVINIGILSKVTFGFFLCVLGVILIAIRERYSGEYPLRYAFGACIVGSLPSIVIWRFFGLKFLQVAAMSAWGIAKYWSIPGMTASSYLERYFVQLGFALIPLTVLFILYIRGIIIEKERRLGRLIPIFTILAYLGIAAQSQNRDPRFSIPIMVALPVCLAWTTSKNKATEVPKGPFLTAFFVGALFCFPMSRRPDLGPIRSASDLLAELQKDEAPGIRPIRVMIATDGAAFNIDTFLLAKQLKDLQDIDLDTLVYDAANERSLTNGFRRIDASNYVLFLKPSRAPGADWTRINSIEYRSHTEEVGTLENANVSPDFDVYEVHRNPAR